MAPTTHRVVQWSTGTIGSYALRAVIEHPHLQLAGVYVHGADKAGRDAGYLCGSPTTGVLATDSVEDIVALLPDCVLYMPNFCNIDEVCRLLAAGSNVVTTAGQFHYPPGMAPEVRAAVERACAAGGTAVYSTGSSPGFISEALPLTLSSIQRRLDNLTIDEYADLSQRDSPELLFDVMGFGQPSRAFDDFRLDYLKNSFGPSLRQLADGLGLPLDSVRADGEMAITARDVQIAAGQLPAGTIGAQRVTITGLRHGEPLVRFRANWYCTRELDTDWPLNETGWHISVVGDAPLEIDLRMPIPLDRMAAVTPSYTANRAVNAVAAVCAAEPGIRTTVDLPHVVAALG